MARIELRNIDHRYSTDQEKSGFALKNLNMVWEDGSANALLGPSGCGKTTLLNMISGLLRPQSGAILFGDQDVAALSPKDRHIAQVFQFPVVYDSMTVEQNLGFPLKNDGMPAADIRKRVHTIAELLELDTLLKNRPASLTPGEKQKVSLGRGIVRTDTAAVLLDEPLTVIDPKQKWELRRKLKQVQTELNLTMIYVTHDQQEALTFADNITVMRNGVIEQTGSPAELYDAPESPFIGFFIGTPGMNFLEIEVVNGRHVWAGEPLDLGDSFGSAPFTLGIRPEHIVLEDGGLPLKVGLIEDTGAYRILTLERGDARIKARVPESTSVREGETVQIAFDPDSIRVYRNQRLVHGGAA